MKPQAHPASRDHRLARYVARVTGRIPRPDLDRVRTSQHPMIDKSLRYWIATDHRVLATTADRDDAIAYAQRLIETFDKTQRVIVTDMVIALPIWTAPGHGWGGR